MIVLPTKYRPLALKRFVRVYNDTGGTLPIHVVFDAADASRYNDIETPHHWKRVSVTAGTPIGFIFDKMFRKYPNEPYYGMIADDVLPETDRWDVLMSEACCPDKIVWGCDEIQNEKLAVHPFIGGDLVRKLGWWSAPGLKHWFVDNVWTNLAHSLNCGVYMPEVKMTHLHPVNGRRSVDRTDREQPNHMADQVTYEKFMKEQFPSAIQRVKSLEKVEV